MLTAAFCFVHTCRFKCFFERISETLRFPLSRDYILRGCENRFSQLTLISQSLLWCRRGRHIVNHLLSQLIVKVYLIVDYKSVSEPRFSHTKPTESIKNDQIFRAISETPSKIRSDMDWKMFVSSTDPIFQTTSVDEAVEVNTFTLRIIATQTHLRFLTKVILILKYFNQRSSK